MLLCRSAAKVNLTLDVLGRRDDGYHELRSVAHTVGLWDTLLFEFDRTAGLLSLRCDDPRLAGEDNLCLQAARAWLDAARAAGWSATNGGAFGLRVTLQKNIPHGAGLGGGSGNAAATLLALNRAFDHPLDDAALHRVAASLGADVPFFLRGGCALLEGIGERLSPLPPLQGWLLIVRPQAVLSSPRVYAAWDALAAPSARATDALLRAMEEDASGAASVERLAGLLSNDLSRAARECGVAAEKTAQRLRACGAPGASMTGSGSAVFGLFDSESAARQALRRWHESIEGEGGGDFDTIVAPLCPRGVEFVDVE